MQGYLELNQGFFLHRIKKKFQNFQTAHLENRKGTKAQAFLYTLKTLLHQQSLTTTTSPATGPCASTTSLTNSKANGQKYLKNLKTFILQATPTNLDKVHFYNSDNLSLQEYVSKLPLKNDPENKTNAELKMEKIKEMIDDGATDLDIAEYNFNIYVSKYPGILRYRLLTAPKRNLEDPPTVIVLCGTTGTGKSYWAKEHYPHAYWKDKNQWFDNYQGESEVIIDEFYGWLPFDLTLRICDKYPLQVEVKGGSVQFQADTIIFTTNKDPKEWWAKCYFAAFKRRVTKWIIKNSLTSEETYTDYSLFNHMFPSYI